MSYIINPYRYVTSGGAFSNDYSVDFDGVDQYCDLGFSTPAESAFTWMGWIKTTDTQGCLVGEINSAGLSVTTRGGIIWTGSKWYFTMGNGSSYSYDNSTHSASAILDGEWHHVAQVVDGTSMKMYVDGSLDASYTSSVSAGTAGTNTLTIGEWGGSYYPVDGKIDEVAFFTSALSSSDITAIYNSGTPASLESYSPYGWWRMGDNDGGTGTTITDQGSGGNDGTLVNGPSYSTDVPAPAGSDYVTITTSATQTVDSSDGDYKWFEFDTTTTSAFTVTDAGGASGSETIEVYCIGGGAGGGDGSGGYGMSGGGGGAGGYIRETSFNNGTTGLAQTYDVTIGGGGGGDSDGSDTQLKDTVSRSVTIESGDYIGVSSDADFGFGTGDYTVEFWLKTDMSVNEFGWQAPLAIGASGLTAFIAVGSKYAALYFGSTAPIQTASNTVKDGVWQHWAISRKTIGASAYTRLWIDGVEEGSTTAGIDFGSSAFIQFGANVYLGGSTVYDMAGELSSMRSYKGTVKYWGAGTNGAGSITPEMPNLAKETSKLLIQPNTGQSDWTDSSDSGHTINSSGLSWPTNLSTSTPNMLAAGGGAGGSSGAGGDGGSGGGGE